MRTIQIPENISKQQSTSREKMVRILRNHSEADFSNQFKNDTKCRNVLMNFDDGKDLGVITMREK